MIDIPMTPVKESSTIQAAGYDPDSSTLALQFKSGKKYHYNDVPPHIAQGLQDAKSKGQYFGQNIKPFFAGIPA